MPTVLRVGPLRFRIHGSPREHPPPHVHISRRGAGWITVRIPTDADSVPVIRDYTGLRLREIRWILALVSEHRDDFLTVWETLHGNSSTEPDG